MFAHIKYWFLGLAPAAVVAHLAHAPAVLVFILAASALIPLAGVLGEATEALAAHLGERWGGLLNATFGNLAELIIAGIALSTGAIELVKLSIIGSIIGNLFIVLGASMVVGGIRHGTVRFSQDLVSPMITLLFLALTAMLVPTIAHHVGGNSGALEHKTIGAALFLLVMYVLLLVFRATHPEEDHVPSHEHIVETFGHDWSTRRAIIILAGAAGTIGIVSEVLIHHLESASRTFGWSAAFVGLFVVPLVGNVAEHSVAIQAAAKNRCNLTVEIAVGSAAQIALFAAPVLVLIAPLMGQELTLVFDPLALEAVGAAVMAAWLVLLDGKSNWFEGAALLLVAGLFGYYTY